MVVPVAAKPQPKGVPVRTIARNHTKIIAKIKAEFTACKVYDSSTGRMVDVDAFHAWDALTANDFARLHESTDADKYTVHLHSNKWYELRRPTAPAASTPTAAEAAQPQPEQPDAAEDFPVLELGQPVIVRHRSYDTFNQKYGPVQEFTGTYQGPERNGYHWVREDRHGTRCSYPRAEIQAALDTPASAKLLNATEDAARKLMARKVAEGIISRTEADKVLAMAVSFVTNHLAKERRSGASPQWLTTNLQTKRDDAQRAMEAATTGSARRSALTRLMCAEIFLAISAGMRVDLATFANNRADAPTFTAGQRIVVADGSTHTVARMLETPGEPLRVEVEDGPLWLASECEVITECPRDCAMMGAHADCSVHGDVTAPPAAQQLVHCEVHPGAHTEVAGCGWPHYAIPAGWDPAAQTHPARD